MCSLEAKKGVNLFSRHVYYLALPAAAPPGDETAVASLYAVEREAGNSVQVNMVVLWVAATTYLMAAAGITAVVLSDEGPQFSTFTEEVLFGFLPAPACAIAGYHLILFGISQVRSNSIHLIEEALVDSLPTALKTKWSQRPSRIGSQAETDWTDIGNRDVKKSMKVTSVFAFAVPTASSAALIFIAAFQIYNSHGWDTWNIWAFLIGYALFAAIYIVLGNYTLML